jgi:RNA-directed DNA polymerase
MKLGLSFGYSGAELKLPIEKVKPRLRGQAYEIGYADHFLLCFQYREDAGKVLAVLRKRFEKYGLTLHPDKTRLIEFGR